MENESAIIMKWFKLERNGFTIQQCLEKIFMFDFSQLCYHMNHCITKPSIWALHPVETRTTDQISLHCMKKAKTLNAKQRLIRMDGCPGRSVFAGGKAQIVVFINTIG